MSVGFLFAFAASLSFAIASFPFTELSRNFSVSRLNLVRLCGASLLLFIASAIVEQQTFFPVFSAAYSHAWIWLGLSGVVSLALGDYLIFRCFTILGPQLGNVLTTFSPASALLFGIFMVGENINWVGITGIAITIAGVIGISLARSQRNSIPDHGHGSVAAGITWGAIASVCHGTGIVFAKKAFIMQEAAGHPIGPLSATFIRVLAGAAALLLIAAFTDRGVFKAGAFKLNTKGRKSFLIATVLNPTMALSLSMFSILYINVAAAQTILAMVPLFALGVALLFYKEKITTRSVIGVTAALIGVILLIWRDVIGAYFGS